MKTKTIVDLAKEVGLHTITCSKCGAKTSGMNAVEQLFQHLLVACREGFKVSIRRFGAFQTGWYGGRAMGVPGTTSVKQIPGRKVLRFHQTAATSEVLNDSNEKE